MGIHILSCGCFWFKSFSKALIYTRMQVVDALIPAWIVLLPMCCGNQDFGALTPTM